MALKENITLPNEVKSESKLHKLDKLSGDSFDKAFLKDAVKDHKTDIRMFQVEAQNGADASVKQFASATLPDLQKHLQLAQNLQKGGPESSQ